MFPECLVYLVELGKSLERPGLPKTYCELYGIWNTILVTLFPPTDGYMVHLHVQEGLPEQGYEQYEGPLEIIFIVRKVGYGMKTALVGRIENDRYYVKKSQIFKELKMNCNDYIGEAVESLYWIAACGCNWTYGQRIKGDTELDQMIDWQENILGEESIQQFKDLVSLVHEIENYVPFARTERPKPKKRRRDRDDPAAYDNEAEAS
jgi:hypothetical protein